jgi:hypothetical protein
MAYETRWQLWVGHIAYGVVAFYSRFLFIINDL